MLLEMRRETKRNFLVSTEILGLLSIFKECQTSAHFETLNSEGLSKCQGMWGSLSRWGWDLGLSLWTTHNIQTSLYIVRWKMSLHSSHCKEIQLSFESGNFSIHCTWGSKFRVLFTYRLLRELSSWGACGKLAYLFNRILGITSLLEMIWGT